MKRLLTILLVIFSIWFAKGQNTKEYERHIKSIEETYSKGYIIDRDDTVFNGNKSFVDFTINHLLKNKTDKYFISNRNILPKLKYTDCDSSKIFITDTLITGEICSITVMTKKFFADSSILVKHKEYDYFELINGQRPYGGEYFIPEIVIGDVIIKLNDKYLEIPDSAFNNFYYPNICESNGFMRKVEAYTSIDCKYIYLYLYGGDAAGTYFCKLIFDKEKYLTRIITDYGGLSVNGCFREDFIGY